MTKKGFKCPQCVPMKLFTRLFFPGFHPGFPLVVNRAGLCYNKFKKIKNAGQIWECPIGQKRRRL